MRAFANRALARHRILSGRVFQNRPCLDSRLTSMLALSSGESEYVIRLMKFEDAMA